PEQTGFAAQGQRRHGSRPQSPGKHSPRYSRVAGALESTGCPGVLESWGVGILERVVEAFHHSNTPSPLFSSCFCSGEKKLCWSNRNSRSCMKIISPLPKEF